MSQEIIHFKVYVLRFAAVYFFGFCTCISKDLFFNKG